MAGPRKQDVTFYLLKGEIANFESCLTKPGELVRYNLPEGVGSLFTRAPGQSNPWWLGFLRQAVPDVPDMHNMSTAAVLFLRVDDHQFALTFGYGRNLLELDYLVRDFGLKVALNTIHPDTLRSVDARTFEELSVARKTQTSRPTGLESFSLNRSEEILKAVTGAPADAAFGHRITGADAVKLTYAPSIAGLADKCRQLITAYQGVAYKERFEFIDHMREERDGPTIEFLDAHVVQKLRVGDYDRMHFAPPEVADWVEIDSFVFSRQSVEIFPDLDPINYRSLFATPENISLQVLKRDKVGVFYAANQDASYKWRVYDTIVCEVHHYGGLYVLTGGSWYRIEPAFADQISAEIAAHVMDVPFLPAAVAGETEPVYNARTAATHGHFLFDAKTVRPNGALSDIEFCDLATADRKLIHVKRKSRSSTLSHLFAQGLQSAETFYADQVFLERLKAKAHGEISVAAAALIPNAKPTPNDWKVIYAIISESNGAWPASLPFFSQLNFRNTAERLSRMGFGGGLARIPIN